MRVSNICAVLIAAFAVPTAVLAQPAPAKSPPAKVGHGDMVYSADGAALGRVDYIQKGKDGAPQYVAVIHDMHMIHIPNESLSTGPKGLSTSLSKADVEKLN